MTNCGAPGCTNRSANNKKISFHRLSSKKEEIKKKWLHNLNRKFIPETLSVAYAALKKIVLDKRLLNDLKYLTDFNHTGTLEVYHSLYNKYSSKRWHFSYPGMIARAQLAVLDFNFGVGSAHCKNKQEDLQYKHRFSKIMQSRVVKKIYKRKAKETYKNHIMDEIRHLQMTSSNYEMPILANVPKCIGGMEKPEKTQTISNVRSGFKTKE